MNYLILIMYNRYDKYISVFKGWFSLNHFPPYEALH